MQNPQPVLWNEVAGVHLDQFEGVLRCLKLATSSLQTRVRTLNGELSAIFKRWYPDMDLEVEEMPVAV